MKHFQKLVSHKCYPELLWRSKNVEFFDWENAMGGIFEWTDSLLTPLLSLYVFFILMPSVKELADTLMSVLDLTRTAGVDTRFAARVAALIPNKQRWELSRVLAGRSVSLMF